MNQTRLQNPLLLGFILLSLLLHLLLIYLVPELDLFPVPPKPDRVVVEMRPVPEPRERELDLAPHPELEKPRTKPAKRLAAADQVVEKETAPQGESLEDMRPDSAAPQASTSRPAHTAPPPQPVEREAAQREAAEGTSRTVTPSEPLPPSVAPLPDLKSLLQLPVNTMARLEETWRQKYRADVEQGDVVWLDTEQDLLFSFFQRLRNGIYNVWNYPPQAARRGEAGTCLIRMTFDRQGELVRSPELLESSGFPELDREALAAVRKGSPYGPLAKSYPKDELTVMAFFRYDLTRSGTRRPGDIFGN